MGKFKVAIQSPDYKFSCAHFQAFSGFRECLHGHNYTVGVTVSGPKHNDGYVIDFGILKSAIRDLCKKLNGYLLVPEKSDVIDIKYVDTQIEMRYLLRMIYYFTIYKL
eukprot:GHVL01032965.1.p1 GENE.GHVL01032965.1~~GHVL01032965.1.p1  ORF type:complete len:108 (+),score=10.71 GHVL01032965.1:66-389(+)